jgi:hypothetical protein
MSSETTKPAGADTMHGGGGDGALTPRKIAGWLLCGLAIAMLGIGLWRWHTGGAGPNPTTNTFDCDVMLRGDGQVVITPRVDATAAAPAAPAAVSAWPAGSAPSAAMSCLRSREGKGLPSPQGATTGLGLYLALCILFGMVALPLLVTTLMSEDAEGKVVSTTRVVVYTLVTCVAVNFVRRMFDGGEAGDIGIDKWLTGLAGVGIAGKVAQTFNEK